MRLIQQVRKEKINYGKDAFAGIVVALVSIPIAMGYAQIAGLPVVYGLYGSLLPILLFGLLSTSPQFVVGVDAMPAVMVGALMTELSITAESKEAMMLAPLMALFVSLWFVIFYLIKAGRVVKYISTPVMGGFISGVGMTIILMQVPKLFGGAAGTGEIFDLIPHIISELDAFNLISFALSMVTIIIILVCKKLIPKIPMTVVMLIVGALLSYFLHLDQYGVKMLPEVAKGLPHLVIPNLFLFVDVMPDLLIQSMSIAAVIMAQTLLATGNYAMKYQDKVDNNKELLAYAAMNLASGISGCCPVNGSVSRSGIADSLKCRSQIMSISAAITMALVLLFFTPYLKYLPVPVLTGIVVTALIGILDFNLFIRLFKNQKNEWIVFMVAFLGVLLFGTVNGVLIGVILAFSEVAVRAVNPPVSYMGRIPGHGNYYSLSRNKNAKPIKETVIYRFSGNLFFANIDRFCQDIESAIKDDTKQVVVDCRGIGSVDITAIDRLIMIEKSLRDRGIRFYLTEHDGSLNDMLLKLGGEELVKSGAVRRTITLALRDSGVHKPFMLEGEDVPEDQIDEAVIESANRLSEFEWLYGEKADDKIMEMASHVVEEIEQHPEELAHIEHEILDGHGVQTDWGMIGLFDENEFLDDLEMQLEELEGEGRLSVEMMRELRDHINRRRKIGLERLDKINPQAREMLRQHRQRIMDKKKTIEKRLEQLNEK